MKAKLARAIIAAAIILLIATLFVITPSQCGVASEYQVTIRCHTLTK